MKEFERYISSAKSKRTVEKYVFEARRFIAWLKEQGYDDLAEIPRNTLNNYVTYLSEEGFMPASLNVKITATRSFLNWCRTEDIKVPQFFSPALPKIPTRVKDILPPESFENYFRLIDEFNEPIRSAAMLLPCSGLRANEMVSLPLKCLKKTKLKFKNGKQKDTLMLIVRGKGDDERLVPLLDEGARVMMEYLRGWRRGHSDVEWMFPGQKRKAHVTSRSLRGALQSIRGTLGVELTPHTMRRTYLTTLYRQGVEPVILAKISGHKNLKTLINYYLYLDEHDLAGAVHGAGGKLITGKKEDNDRRSYHGGKKEGDE